MMSLADKPIREGNGIPKSMFEGMTRQATHFKPRFGRLGSTTPSESAFWKADI